MTREELEKTGLATLSDVISQIPGIGISNGTRGQGWVSSKHHVMTIRSITQLENHAGDDTYVPDATERRSGMVKGCYARVYLDRQLLNPYTPAEPINVNEFSPDRLEAIEFYQGPLRRRRNTAGSTRPAVCSSFTRAEAPDRAPAAVTAPP